MNRTLLTLLITLNACLVEAADFATEMIDATFKLGDGGSVATSFFVRREPADLSLYLVTAGHSFDGEQPDRIVITLRKAKPDGSYERFNYDLPIRRNGKPLWVRHEKHDVAVLRVVEPLPVPVAALPLSALADETRLKAAGVNVCSALYILAYPEGLEAGVFGFPVARGGIFASSPFLARESHPHFLADYHAFQGDSGGPAFVAGTDGHPLVVGTVCKQHYYTFEMNGRDEDHSVRIPLGVVNILHAQYARDTIELAAKKIPADLK